MVKVDFKAGLQRRLHIKSYDEGFHTSIRRTLLCPRLLGLLPLSGLYCRTSHKLRFTFRSPYTLFFVISLFGQISLFVMALYWLIEKEITLSNITNSIFYTSSLISSLILVNIGRNWPAVVKAVEEIEATLPPCSRNVSKKCDTVTTFVLVAAIVEHSLSFFYGMRVAYACNPNDVAKALFHFNMPWIFEYTSYSLWKGIIGEIFNIQCTFIWSFNDLLIMVISIYLTEQIIQYNDLFKKAVTEGHFSTMQFRLQNLSIVRLVRVVNGQVGIYILTSFSSNLYWICTQLFNSLNKEHTGHFIACHDKNPSIYETLDGIEHTVYFMYSFLFIVLRTLLVLLLASRIHSNSNVPLVYLYGLPSEKFDIEVERFIAQINNIKVALSGLDFFYVTRTMILTLLGTIVTYELVLLQFNK